MRCGGRGSVRHATVRRAGGVMPSVSEYLVSWTTALKRTGKTCGPGTQSWCQVFGGCVRLNRVGHNLNPKATVARELSRRGERVINRKTIVWGMPDDPVPRCYSCASAVFLHARPRVPLGIAAFPAPSVIRGRDVLAKARAPGAAGRLFASGFREARASTSFFLRRGKDVDGRDRPGRSPAMTTNKVTDL